jgi:type IV pilus assembly protein PilB
VYKNLRLGEILKQAGIIDDFQLDSALSYQRYWGGRLGESLIRLGYITEENMQDFLVRQFELPRIELFGRQIPAEVLHAIPVDKAREFHVIPVERGEMNGARYLVVAMTDPTNVLAIDSLQFMAGCHIRPALASSESIRCALDLHYGAAMATQEALELSFEELADRPRAVAAGSSGLPVTQQAFRCLEERFENLLKILRERGVLPDLDSRDIL